MKRFLVFVLLFTACLSQSAAPAPIESDYDWYNSNFWIHDDYKLYMSNVAILDYVLKFYQDVPYRQLISNRIEDKIAILESFDETEGYARDIRPLLKLT